MGGGREEVKVRVWRMWGGGEEGAGREGVGRREVKVRVWRLWGGGEEGARGCGEEGGESEGVEVVGRR